MVVKIADSNQLVHQLVPQPNKLWYKDAVIYQVHIKSFFDSNADGYGDFPGLVEKLDYIQDLGANCLWLLPFYPSPMKDDGYDISDYRSINPVFGTRRDFRTFIHEAHRRNIKVITELVINHTSDQHPWFQASRNAPKNSKKRDYYVWSDTEKKYKDARIIFLDTEKSNWTWDPIAEQFFWHRFFSHQPDLNFDNPSVMQAVLRVMRFWLDMGVDGMRLDAIPYLVERDNTNCENLPETHSVLREFRRNMDEKYQDRILLAEANQWPTDVRQYFGNGDECHMAFHFPLMPRLFMGVHQENSHPIVDILQQTPEIPENCQWAIFLRNHDELTLEMVTADERAYMYEAYAADPMMRINLGIRRRLAPLLQHSRSRIELMNALLFSLPGTPVIYYGDELGMGENIFLGDRNGVRTPMQWNGDRNAGFSKALFAKLYSPPNMDPITGYQAINVEAQTLDPSSLLNWMKSMIKLRKQHKVFGRGSIEVLEPENHKIFAFVRKYEEETVLVVANLSRYPQSVELELSRYSGRKPVEMFGLGNFHAITDKPYVLTLGGNSYYWLLLEAPAASLPITAPEKATDTGTQQRLQDASNEIPMLARRLTKDWHTFLGGSSRAKLEREVLPVYLVKQRWFGGKARKIESTKIIDWLEFTDLHEPSAAMFVEVTYEHAGSDIYQLFLALATDEKANELISEQPENVIAEFSTEEAEGKCVIYDALSDDRFCHHLLSLIEDHEVLYTDYGVVKAERLNDYTRIRGDRSEPLAVKRMRTEQSNTSILFGNNFMMKMFRHLEKGRNPDYELGKYLHEKTSFRNVPSVAGLISYANVDAKKPSYSLGLLQEFVANHGDGWAYTLEEFRRFYERVSLQENLLERLDPGTKRIPALVSEDIPVELNELLGIYLREARLLGARTAELHAALAEANDEPELRAEPCTKKDLDQIVKGMSRDIERTLQELSERIDTLPEDVIEPVKQILGYKEKVLEIIRMLSKVSAPMEKIRCHGDYHLGQVLYTSGDFMIIDFEGEPTKSISERHKKQLALKDIAGMLRSFNYASYASLYLYIHNRPSDLERMLPWAKILQTWVSVAFIKGYRTASEGASFIPADNENFFKALFPFVVDKAFYEIDYELNNRPDWIKVPVSSILEYLKAATLSSEQS
jgi:maltose alpha-D-glucosyltransferase/alpha-amylase